MTRVQRQQLAFGGLRAESYLLSNDSGMRVNLLNYGATITEISVPDRHGKFGNVALAYPAIDQYLSDCCYLGAQVGPFANRIANGCFELDGETIQLEQNAHGDHLHGETAGIHRRLWRAEIISDGDGDSLVMVVEMADGEGGYPGNRRIEVGFSLSPEGDLLLRYRASSDKVSVINPSCHVYFDLSAGRATSILDHHLSIAAPHYLPVNPRQIPTGVMESVSGTPFDFRAGKPIGVDIDSSHGQISVGNGFDHCWVFDKTRDSALPIASVSEPLSGRSMEVFTDQPGMQFYSGNGLSSAVGFEARLGFCLETQHFPDSPNQPSFPSVRLSPGVAFESWTRYRFSNEKK